MKKIALAIAMATSASFASAQLSFAPGSAIQDQIDCDFTIDPNGGVQTLGACGTTSYNFGIAAYDAAEALANATDEVAFRQGEADQIPPANLEGSPEQNELNLAIENEQDAQQTLNNYQTIAGDVSSAAISLYEAESDFDEKFQLQFDAATNQQNAAAVLQPLNDEVDITEQAKEDRSDDYFAAVAALNEAIANDEDQATIENLETAKNTAIGEYNTANEAFEAAVAAATVPQAAFNLTDGALTIANANLEESTTALEANRSTYSDLLQAWEENVDSTVDQAEFNLLVANQQLADEQGTLDDAMVELSSAQGELQGAQDAVAAQQVVIDDATAALEAAEDDTLAAQEAFDNALPADQAAAAEALDLAETAEQAATDVLLQANLDSIPLDQAENEADLAVAQAGLDVEAAQQFVDASTDVAPFEDAVAQLQADNADQADIDAAQALVDGSANVTGLTNARDEASADQAVHESYLGSDPVNPAGALMASFIDENDDDAQAIVTAVSSNYDSTVVNATAIDVNEGRIDDNVTAIGVNATAIDVNATAIGVNATAIDVNEGRIDVNEGRIDTNQAAIVTETNERVAADDIHTAAIGINASGINDNAVSIGRLSDDLDTVRSGVAATLAVAGMPLAPTEGWGAAIGTGYFDGESAVAAGLTFRSDRYNFKFAVGTSGGETTGSAGVSWGF